MPLPFITLFSIWLFDTCCINESEFHENYKVNSANKIEPQLAIDSIDSQLAIDEKDIEHEAQSNIVSSDEITTTTSTKIEYVTDPSSSSTDSEPDPEAISTAKQTPSANDHNITIQPEFDPVQSNSNENDEQEVTQRGSVIIHHANSASDDTNVADIVHDSDDTENINVPLLYLSDRQPSLYLSESEEADVIEGILDSEETEVENRLLFEKYKSKRQMLDGESIKCLLAMILPPYIQNILGDSSSYEIPSQEEQKEEYFHLERDLRKIQYSLKDFKQSEKRKYAKLSILKHYKILNTIYTKYCKIGGDANWLNLDGYLSLLRDVGVITTGNPQNERYFDIFHEIYIHHSKQLNKSKTRRHCKQLSRQLSGLYGTQSFHDRDPWTGVWCKYKDKQKINRIETAEKYGAKMSTKQKSAQYYEKYKLRKIGDKRIIGCMNSIDYAEIGGTFEKSNYKKAKIEIKFKKRRIKVHNQRRLWFCEIIPPQSMIDDIIMKVKWEEINIKSFKTKEGNLKLYKHDDLQADDVDIPVPELTGLSRSEFFDAMLSCAQLLDDIIDTKSHQDLYLCFDHFVMEYLNEYIYKKHCELEKYLKGKEIVDGVKNKLRAHNPVLIKLFKKYASLDNSDIATKKGADIGCDEWSALAVELCKAAKTFDKDIWKMGGKPSMVEIIQCFTLSVDDELLSHNEMSFVEFQRCLIIFTNAIFKYHPGAKYAVLDFHDKLDLVLKWCQQLEAQKMKISSKSYTKSETHKQIKRKRESMRTQQSAQKSQPKLLEMHSAGLSVTYESVSLRMNNSV